MTTASPPSSGPTTPPGGNPSRRRAVEGAIVAAVVVVVALLVVFATGLLTSSGGSSSTSTSGSYLTFQQAESVAQAAVGGTPNGPWSSLLGIGVAAPQTATLPTGNLTGIPDLSNCTVDWTHGTAPNVTVPVTPSDAGWGRAAFWIVGFVNSASNLRLMTVTLGNASEVATISGGRCTSVISYLEPLSQSVVVDSPTVAQNVSAAGAGAWRTGLSNVTETWEIVPGAALGLIAPVWHAVYTTCSLGPGGPLEGSEFSANLTASTGYVTVHTNRTVSCGGGIGTLVAGFSPLPSVAARQTI